MKSVHYYGKKPILKRIETLEKLIQKIKSNGQ